MRYLTADVVYAIHLTLRRAYSRLGQGQTFNPPYPPDEVYARLDAAVARPRAEFLGVAAHQTLFSKVAALGLGIAQGHVFGNGNKRTALSAMIYMMNLNGWEFLMPARTASLMMLRIASSDNRMSLGEAASLIGAWSGFGDIDHATELIVQAMIAKGSIVVVAPNDFPALAPTDEPKTAYNDRATEIVTRHFALLPDNERTMLAESFEWPDIMSRMLVTWSHVQEHKKHHVRRKRYKTVGIRRRPHCGGRTVPKICQPITLTKLKSHRVSPPTARRPITPD